MAVGAAAEVKSKLGIVDVVGETVALKKAGTTFKGLCPFHSEKTPSFVVTPARETYKCFGCGKGGDIFSFVMERDTVDFRTALQRLAAKAGVELDERTAREDAKRARMREVLETAIAFYHAILVGHRTGEPARDYLHGRGFTDETIERFQLGWAPTGWDTLTRELEKRRGISAGQLVEVGLATARGSGRGDDRSARRDDPGADRPSRDRGAYDRFRGRIIFPIRDTNGNAVGLGGRVLEGQTRGDGPKYLNSPATPLFDKSRTLYLVDKAKTPIRKGGQAVIVEGYTDALMAHQAGFDNVVASLGTALTPGQVAILSRYARRIALAYDVDPAGQSAGTFGVTELSQLIGEIQASGVGIGLADVRVVELPDGRDPDEVIRDAPDAWTKAVESPKPIVDFLIDHHAGRFDVKTPEGRKAVVDGVLPAIRRIGDPQMRDEALQHLARRSTVDYGVLKETLARRGPAARPDDGHAGQRITLEAVLAASDMSTPEEVLRGIQPVEAELLRFVLLLPELQVRAAEQLAPEQLPSTVARELYRAVLADRDRDREVGGTGRFDRARFLEALDDETKALALAIYQRPGPDLAALDVERARIGVDQCVLRLERAALQDEHAYNQAEIADAELRGDRAAIQPLLERDRQLNEALRSIHRRIEQMSLLTRTADRSGGPAAPTGGTR